MAFYEPIFTAAEVKKSSLLLLFFSSIANQLAM